MALMEALFGMNQTRALSQAWPGTRDITTPAMQQAISDWYALYYDRVLDNKREEDPCQRIPCTIVAKLQKACFSEYEAEVNGQSAKAEFLSGCQRALDKARKKAMQHAMIGGEAWLKPVPTAAGFAISVVRRDSVAVLARNPQDEVTDMILAEHTAAGGQWYHLLERRTVDENGLLTIQNRLYRSGDRSTIGVAVPLSSLPQYAALEPEYSFPQPVGSIGLAPVRMPMENCVDGSADAVSVYAAAEGLIHAINHNEYLLSQEFDNGRIRVLASEDLLHRERDADGNVTRKYFPGGLFTGLDGSEEQVGITVFNPSLRDQSFLARKTEYLRNVENVIGLKRGLLSDVEAAQRTAKEITSSEGDYNLTIQELWQVWDAADREALRLCDVLGQMYRLCDAAAFDPLEDVSISWGNGVLYDADKVWTETMGMVAAGLLKPELALAWKYDLPCDTPEDLAAIREKYMPEMEQLLEG